MIVRILSEGQWMIDEADLSRLNNQDAAVEQALASGDQAALTEALEGLLQAVRTIGTPVPDDVVVESALILPPADATVEQVQAVFDEQTDGLIPG